MKQIKFGYLGIAAAAALGMGIFNAGQAKADITVSDVPPSVTLTSSGTYLYTYEVFLTTNHRVESGNLFTFYDFDGLIGVGSSPVGWSSSVAWVTEPPIVPAGTVNPHDSAVSQNVTFTYNGPTINTPGSLGFFSLESALGPGSWQSFVGNATYNLSNRPNLNLTEYLAPVPEPGEYAFAAIFGGGLLGLMVRARRRGKSNLTPKVA